MKKTVKFIMMFFVLAIIASTCHINNNLTVFSKSYLYGKSQKPHLATQYLAYSPEQPRQPNTLKVVYGNKSAVFALDDRPLKSNIFIHHEEYQKYNRNKSYEHKANTLKVILSQGWSYESAVRFMFAHLRDDIERWLVLHCDQAPKDAALQFNPDASPIFTIVKERQGLRADRERLYRDICLGYLQNSHVEVNVHTMPVEAKITTEYLKQETYYRGGFSTGFAGSIDSRKHNIRLALKKINGTVLRSGEVFSFNKTVGPRTFANGFLEAKIILGGKYEMGVGGGVCQASTTLYNAALLADMKILAANPHSLRISYIEPSFDAMVNSGWSDLKFQNTSDRPVYIRAYTEGDRAYVSFYGAKMPYRISRAYKITKVIPHGPTQHIIDKEGKYAEFVKYKGQTYIAMHPKDGVESEGYLRYYTHDGILIREVKIRTDKYKEQNGLIVEGAQEPPAVTPDNTPPENFIEQFFPFQ